MTKKHFIALADAIRDFNKGEGHPSLNFHSLQVEALANWCKSQNPNFNRDRWLKYIYGEMNKFQP